MRATKIALASFGVGTALLCTGAYAQDYRIGRSPNDNGLVQMQQNEQNQQQKATPGMRQREGAMSTSRSNAAARSDSASQQTAAYGEAPRAAPQYRTGRSPDDNGMVSVQAQGEQPAPEQFAWQGDRQYYNYNPTYGSPTYGSEWGFGAPEQRLAQNDIAACEARFRSFDPASGTYLGFDGARHPCP